MTSKNQKTKPFIVACIPALNEEKTIAQTIEKTRKYVDQIIICDDGSTDNTAELVKQTEAVLLHHEKNMGKGKALQTCFQYILPSKPDIILTLDGDGQHDPDEIPLLLKPLQNNQADLVIGSRYVQGSKTDAPLYRKFGLEIVNMFGESANKNVKDSQSGFRAFNYPVLKIFSDISENGFGVETGQLASARKYDLRVAEIPVTIRYDGLENTSKKTPLLHGLELVTAGLRLMVLDKPLMIMGIPGFLLIMSSLLSGNLLIHYYFTETYFSLPLALITFSFLLVGALLIISGLILYVLSQITVEIRKLRYAENI